MGQDKALVYFRDQPLIRHVLTHVTPVADELLVVTSGTKTYDMLGVPVFSDALPGRGPLGGLYTALLVAHYPAVAVVACDMPFVNPELLVFENELLISTPADLVVPKTPTGLEPLHAVYRREICLPLAQGALDAGQSRTDAWFAQAQMRTLTPKEIQPYDPRGLAFFNINTPQDLNRALNYT
jgi:molybdopterin-guanine dinucleotide biosynthesis protein A